MSDIREWRSALLNAVENAYPVKDVWMAEYRAQAAKNLRLTDSVNASNTLLGSEIAIPVTLYGVGLFKGDAHAREAGILSGEALADSVVVDQVAKIIFRRERPLYHNAAGDFFSSSPGKNNSFPSSHSMLAWTIAGVTAGEYPSKWVQLGTYSLATSVSLMRVLGQEHFPTDVLAGGAAGWLIGHYVFEKHQLRHVKKTLRGKTHDATTAP